MAPLSIPLRTVFYRDDDSWIAHCLEFDLIGDGQTKKEALENLCKAVLIQLDFSVKNNNMRNLFSPADGELFRRFAAGKKSDVAVGKLLLSVESLKIENVEAREYSESAM